MKGNMKVLVSFLGGIICSAIIGILSWKFLPIPNADKCSIMLACFNILPFTAVTNGCIKKYFPVVMSGLGASIWLSTFIILIANVGSGYKVSEIETTIIAVANTFGFFTMMFSMLKDVKNGKEKQKEINAYHETLSEEDNEIPSEVLKKLPEAYEEVSSQLQGEDVML